MPSEIYIYFSFVANAFVTNVFGTAPECPQSIFRDSFFAFATKAFCLVYIYTRCAYIYRYTYRCAYVHISSCQRQSRHCALGCLAGRLLGRWVHMQVNQSTSEPGKQSSSESIKQRASRPIEYESIELTRSGPTKCKEKRRIACTFGKSERSNSITSLIAPIPTNIINTSNGDF